MLPRAFALLIALLVAGCLGTAPDPDGEGSEKTEISPQSSDTEGPAHSPAAAVGNSPPSDIPSFEQVEEKTITRSTSSGLEIVITAYHGHAEIQVPMNGTLEVREQEARVWQQDVVAGLVEVGFLEPKRLYDVFFSAPNASVALQFQTSSNPTAWNGDTDGAGPGRYLVAESVSQCTAGFFLRDWTNSTLYLMTAGHCFPHGTIVKDAQYRAVGVVEVSHVVDGLDYALIRVDQSYRPFVQAALPHWTGPSAPQDHIVEPDDVICGYGYGAYISATEQTRARCGRFWTVERQTWGGQDMDIWIGSYVANDGDSGGPVIDAQTGMPIGILLSALRGVEVAGVTFCSVVDLAQRMHGLELRIVPTTYVPRDPIVDPLPVPAFYGNHTPMNTACAAARLA